MATTVICTSLLRSAISIAVRYVHESDDILCNDLLELLYNCTGILQYENNSDHL